MTSDMKVVGFLWILTFCIELCLTSDKKLSEDANFACIIRFLQIKGKLSENFQKVTAPPDLCRIILPLIYANHSEKLCRRLYQSKNGKAACINEQLKDANFIDLELMHEVFIKSEMTNKKMRRDKIFEIMHNQRLILEKVAKDCESNPTYLGVFDRILGINSSHAAIEQNHCILHYSINNGFLDIPRFKLNPMNLTTSATRCREVIGQVRSEKASRLIQAFRRANYSSEAIQCLLDKYYDERIFGWNLAKDIVNKINIDDNLRRGEDLRLSRILADFSPKSTNCLYSFNWELFQ